MKNPWIWRFAVYTQYFYLFHFDDSGTESSQWTEASFKAPNPTCYWCCTWIADVNLPTKRELDVLGRKQTSHK